MKKYVILLMVGFLCFVVGCGSNDGPPVTPTEPEELEETVKTAKFGNSRFGEAKFE